VGIASPPMNLFLINPDSQQVIIYCFVAKGHCSLYANENYYYYPETATSHKLKKLSMIWQES